VLKVRLEINAYILKFFTSNRLVMMGAFVFPLAFRGRSKSFPKKL